MSLTDTSADRVDEATRQTGREHEISFWRDFVNSDRFRWNWCKAKPNPELEVEIDILVRLVAMEAAKGGERASIVDIGSGPVSILSNSISDLEIDLIATDPLADDYDGLWDSPEKASLATPVKCSGERLVSQFGPRRFELSHIRNALDHSVHPMTVLQQMIAVTKPGGYVVVHGFQNEASAEGWAGFHQWNIARCGNDVGITGQTGVEHRVLEAFEGLIAPVRIYDRPHNHKVWFGMVLCVL